MPIALLQGEGQVEALAIGDGVDGPNLAGGGLAAVGLGLAVAVGMAVRVPVGVAVAIAGVGMAVAGRGMAVGRCRHCLLWRASSSLTAWVAGDVDVAGMAVESLQVVEDDVVRQFDLDAA